MGRYVSYFQFRIYPSLTSDFLSLALPRVDAMNVYCLNKVGKDISLFLKSQLNHSLLYPNNGHLSCSSIQTFLSYFIPFPLFTGLISTTIKMNINIV